MHIHHDNVLTLELRYRERLALRCTVFHGGQGPTVAILAGVHGVPRFALVAGLHGNKLNGQGVDVLSHS
jgi:predicted deacylase